MLLNQQLESLIEQHGIFYVMDALAKVCGKRAEAAKNFDAKDNWEAVASAIDNAASKILDVRLTS